MILLRVYLLSKLNFEIELDVKEFECTLYFAKIVSETPISYTHANCINKQYSSDAVINGSKRILFSCNNSLLIIGVKIGMSNCLSSLLKIKPL